MLKFVNVTALKAEATATGSKFFTPATMRFFGTRNLRLYGGRVLVGTDLNAPEGYPRHWVRTWDYDMGGMLTDTIVAQLRLREDAVALAKDLAKDLAKTETKEV